MTAYRKKSNLTELESASRWTLLELGKCMQQCPAYLGCACAYIQLCKQRAVSAQLQDFVQDIQMLVMSSIR